MSNEINQFLQQSGWTVYVVIQNKSGQLRLPAHYLFQIMARDQ